MSVDACMGLFFLTISKLPRHTVFKKDHPFRFLIRPYNKNYRKLYITGFSCVVSHNRLILDLKCF